MNYSVVVVTYNRLSLLQECLGNILNQSLSPCDVVIVNNASNDGTKEYLDRFAVEYPVARVIHSRINLGGAGGFKLALANVNDKSDYILIIDDDAMIDRYFLQEIDNNICDGVFAYSGSVFTHGNIDCSHRRRISNKILLTKTDVDIHEYKNTYFDYDLSTFCGLVISNTLLKKIGFPREDFFIWYDDTEYSLRIKKYSIIRNVNGAKLNHKTKIANSDKLGWKSYYGYRNFWYVGKQYSTHPLIFDAYRKMFHCIKRMICRLKIVRRKDSEYYSYLLQMHKNVPNDVQGLVMGKNINYMP